MIYYIDGNEVNQAEAKAYFFAGHKQTVDWLTKRGATKHAKEMGNAAAIWSEREILTVQDQIHSISGIQEHGGLEITEG